MVEKNILAYFKSPEEAEGAVTKLKSLRAIEVSVDTFSKYPGNGVEGRMNPITSNFPSLGALTLGADFSSPGAGILAAADVSASGMSGGGQEGPTGRNILLTAVVEEQMHEQALQVIKESGGEV